MVVAMMDVRKMHVVMGQRFMAVPVTFLRAV